LKGNTVNQIISRRTLLGSTAMVAPALLLNGCSGLSSLPQFATDVENIAGMLSNAAPTLATLTGVAQGTINKVTGLINTASTIAGAVTSAASAGASGVGALVSNFASNFGSIAGALGVNVPGLWGTVIQAGASLLPSILSAAGIALAGPTVQVPNAMSTADARKIVVALAAKS
jgi:hypothetical protein